MNFKLKEKKMHAEVERSNVMYTKVFFEVWFLRNLYETLELSESITPLKKMEIMEENRSDLKSINPLKKMEIMGGNECLFTKCQVKVKFIMWDVYVMEI